MDKCRNVKTIDGDNKQSATGVQLSSKTTRLLVFQPAFGWCANSNAGFNPFFASFRFQPQTELLYLSIKIVPSFLKQVTHFVGEFCEYL